MEQLTQPEAVYALPQLSGASRTVAGPAWQAISRALQVAVSAVGLVVFSPVMLVLAAAIKAVSKGPVFYSGPRVGKGGREFYIYKFRTLETYAEKRIGARLLQTDDPFHHRVGKFLKRSKLDEIPQLFNVIKGDMNLVGPRPVRPVFLEEFAGTIHGYMERFAVRPGMTGIAQLRGGYFTSPRNKLRYENIYIRNRSLRLDLGVLMLTFVKLLQRWITAGSLLFALVIFVSFVPSQTVHSFSMVVLGVRFNLLLPTILTLGAYLILHAGRSHKWLISHSAVDWPMAAFVFVSAMAVPFSVSPVTAFRGLIYLCTTGFFFAFVLVNTRPDEHFARRATQLLGIAGGLIALVGLAETCAALVGLIDASSGVRSVATLGTPLALTAYLALCFPLVLCEFFTSRGRLRLMWLAAAVAIAGATLTAGSRLGVPALIVSGGLLMVKTGKLRWQHVVAAGAACVVMLCVFGGQRYGIQSIGARIARDGGAAITAIQQSSFQQLLIGYGTKTVVYP
ncbi:MAG: sugar transferase, partial [Planctomycetes bacterium]|nr:sugar transferase [Planctomycetota bacterium]